jgi:hypothetical protein
MRPLRPVLFLLASVAVFCVASPAAAQDIEGVPCPGQPLKCLDLSAPDFQIPVQGVVRMRFTANYTDAAGGSFTTCCTAWHTDSTYVINGVTYCALVTARHCLFDTLTPGDRPYRTVAASIDMFYYPLRSSCGAALGTECPPNGNAPVDSCATPVTLDVPCWDWDNTCDVGRLLIPCSSKPANVTNLKLCANDAATGDSVWIPQHPRGRCMEWDKGRVTANPGGCYVVYTVSTEGGSSGSPVLRLPPAGTPGTTQNMCVVAVHTGTPTGNCPNHGVDASQIMRFMSVHPTQNANLRCPPATSTEATSWGKVKGLFQ